MLKYKFKLVTEHDISIRKTSRMPIALFNKDIQDIVRQHTKLNFLDFTYVNPDVTVEDGHRIVFYIPTRFTRVTDLLIIYIS